MEQIGTVKRLQVQPSSLKVGENPRRYDPAPLREVAALRLSPAGVTATDADGQPIVDVHNQQHPASKNRDRKNGISLGFTGHYAAMRDRFGPHLIDGIAGENILIGVDRLFLENDLTPGVVIATDDGRQIVLSRILVAAPCVEFTRWALRFPANARPDASVTEGLQFLHQGMRGYYASHAGDAATIRVGDRVFLT